MRLAQSVSRTGQTSARFERLRARLAALQHPAIPAPIDSGSTPTAGPISSSAAAAGVPIDAYCAAHGLDLARRARLFAQVCRAVHYMHQHLIVHRDLKPADMLFDGARGGARPTLLDAGMIGEGWPLEPAYASPDQLAGLPLSAGSDIYSLGAVLYLLLSGRQAHGGGDAAGVTAAAAQASVMPPSQPRCAQASRHGAATWPKIPCWRHRARWRTACSSISMASWRAHGARSRPNAMPRRMRWRSIWRRRRRLETPAAVAPVVEARQRA